MSTSFLRRLLVLSIAVTAVAVVVSLPRIAAQAPASATVPAEIPAEARNRVNPRPATPESIAEGKKIFASQCAMCHGPGGDGKGELAARLKYEIPDFTQPTERDRRTDGELFYILKNGHGKMMGEGERLPDETKWDLVNFIRSLAKTG